MKRSKRKKLENKLDQLWRSIGKENAFCEICATLPVKERVNYSQLHPHHIIKRGHKATRWDLRNRIWVDPTHHVFGKKTVEYNEGGWFLNWESDNDWMGKNRKEDKEHLRKLNVPYKQWTLEELENLIEELK